MELWTATSWHTVFKDECKSCDATEQIKWIAARNEYESAQIVMRHSEAFTVTEVRLSDLRDTEGHSISGSRMSYRFIDYVYLESNSPGIVNAVREAPAEYPERLSNERTRDVEADCAQPIWITIYVPKEAKPGLYAGTADIATTAGTYLAELELEICNVQIPDAPEGALTISYWSWNAGRMMAPDEDDQIRAQYGYERYSPDWWRLMERFADSWREHRMNELLVHHQTLLLDGGTTIDEAGAYRFGWGRFDEVLSFFDSRGCVKAFTGTRLLFPPSKDDPYEVYLIRRDSSGRMVRELAPLDSVEAENWWKQYLPALRAHLIERGWWDRWRQQIGDEPHTEVQRDQWLSVKGWIDAYAPGMRIGDAFCDPEYYKPFEEKVDVWVPQLNVLQDNKSYFDTRAVVGEQVWMYTCGFPKGAYLNRFLDQPAWMGRNLLWLCYRWGLPGFLHWGWNIWQFPIDAYEARGDAYIVWPDQPNGTIMESVRSAAVRDGAEEYELLRLLERRNPQRAAELASAVVVSGTEYSTDIELMRRKREELLRACSEEE